MHWAGKIIGGILGFVLAGPVGFLLGLIIGHQFDKGLVQQTLGMGGHAQKEAQQAFFNATFKVMGHVAKADGRVTENEIRAARSTMERMRLSEAQRRLAMQFFNEGKQSDFDLQAALDELLKSCHKYRPLLQMFVEMQLQAAMADGHMSQNKQAILKHICQKLGFSMPAFFIFEEIFGNAQRQYQQYQQQHGQGGHGHYQQHNSAGYGRPSLDNAYKILGITASATQPEVKKAYRRLMSQNHPDKLVAKGLPEEMMKMATLKTQQIQEAYEQVCAAKGY